MKSTTFYSKRLNKYVTVIMTHNCIHYITSNDRHIKIPRWEGCHFDDIHFNDTIDIFEDPRFDYWVETDEFSKF